VEMEASLGRLGRGIDPSKKVVFCLVGLGRAGSFHLTSLRNLSDRAELKWIIDVNEETLQKTLQPLLANGVKGSTKLSDALEDDSVDAVIIASTTHAHYEQVVACFEAGKAVLCEKPISHDPERLGRVMDVAKLKRLPFLVGYQRRMDRNFRSLKKQLEAGAVGTPRIIKCCSRDNPEPPLWYLKISGGIFHDMLCHDFDMLHFLTGQVPVAVFSAGHAYNAEIAALDDVDTASVTLMYASGLIAMVDTSRTAAYGYDQRVEVFGEHGMLQASNVIESTVSLSTGHGHTAAPNERSFPQRYPQAYQTEVEEFIEMVRHWTTDSTENIDRHVSLEAVTTAAELSWRLGRKILLSEVDSLRSHVAHHLAPAAH